MHKARIVFFGTEVWELTSRHLKMFMEDQANIVAFVEAPLETLSTTVTKKDPYENICKAAKRLDIPIHCPKDLKDREFLNYLKSFKADIFIVCGFQFLLPAELLSIPPMGVLNFHSSLLPRHAGMHPGFFTIYYGDRESGMTIHYMDEGLDTGDIVYVSKVPVYYGDNIASLYDRIWDSSEGLVKRLLTDLDNKALPRIPQDMSKYFYNYEISEQDYELDFRVPAEVLSGRVKMMPGKFYFTYKGSRYYVKDSTCIGEPAKGRFYKLRTPFICNNKLTFLTPRNYLQIEELVKDSKKIDPLSILD